ncbi:flagellar biosynthesis protein FlhA [Parasphingorhabdus cellanae]|uniref:Flagellar biosynthesis protein FlhA n=1 Tax=Parasphingorhabdus cellanae TaxID=2806553 RepID=A0ABX7T5S5_9SPHN|nr:flagellar biosynthesis protein FlhA [Parasphingorhabdus cellanae]QTD56486.1 flagellar biosynthesis protein FlhA [Parasphingorhabdus cellanae]
MLAFLSSRHKWLGDTAKAGILPVATLLLVIFMVLPVPATVLDIGFIANITIALAVLMVALNVAKPLDFSSFPTVLLFATLLRLALNVASTRVVLVEGHAGPHAAGQVIEAFGNFLIGGDYVVGIFVFTILMIINLVVITKGAGRVSEVTARFTLDALPGKQMAIDADLNAGLLSPEEAKQRRQDVATESDFYGSMDGASKFVKGDAVAGVLILIINIIGGMILGVFSYDMAVGDAAQTYVLLAVGDALVAQVPALLLSIAAAAIVTRVASPMDLPGQIGSQFGNPKAWIPVAAILVVMGLLPGMPHIIILPIAAVAGFLAWRMSHKEKKANLPEPHPQLPEQQNHIGWSDVTDGAVLAIEIGYGLVPLVDDRKGAPLMQRLTGIRRQLSRELGFVVPLVRVKDNMALPPNAYRIQISGVTLGEDQAWPDDLLALDSGDIDSIVDGEACQDPTFGLDSLWIAPEKRSEAVVSGYTVVDASTVIATHFNHLVGLHAAELFGMDEAQGLLDNLKETAPQLVEGLTPKPLSLFQVTAICRSLLSEGIPLKDFRRLSEAMIHAAADDSASDSPSLENIVDGVRRRIGSLIIQSLVPVKMPLPVITLDVELESLLAQAIEAGGGASRPVEPGLVQKIVSAVEEAARPIMAEARRFAVVTSPIARRTLLKILKPSFPGTPVLSFEELPDDKAIEVVAVVGSRSSKPSPSETINSETVDHKKDLA